MTWRSPSAVDTGSAGSASLDQPDYWWYRARSELLEATHARHLGVPRLLLDVGSADGPSVRWTRSASSRVAVDLNPRGLRPGEGVCASAMRLPFEDETFDVVVAFDVLEHCEPESSAVDELTRVLVPGGRLLMSVPAYQWAWTDHDVLAGHHRRYTRPRLIAAVAGGGLEVLRSTYGFAAVFPFFVVERLLRRVRRVRPGRTAMAASAQQRLTEVPPALDKVLMALCRVEARWLSSRNLPFGSSVFLAAVKPAP